MANRKVQTGSLKSFRNNNRSGMASKVIPMGRRAVGGAPLGVRKNESSLPLGELLVQEGMITREQLNEAIKSQVEMQGATVPLGEILIKQGFVEEGVLEGVFNEFGINLKLGESLVKQKYITNEQLVKITEHQEKTGERLGKIIVDGGIMTHDAFCDFLSKKVNIPRLGEALVTRQVITQSTLDKALKVQNSHRYLGDLMLELGYITQDQLSRVLDKYTKREALSAVLLREGFVTDYELEDVDHDIKSDDKRLGEALLERGVITSEQLGKALAVKFDIPFKRFSQSNMDRGALPQLRRAMSKQYAQKNGVIPVSINNNTLGVAIRDVANLRHVGELRQMMPKHRFSCFLTPDEDFYLLTELLYGEGKTIKSLDADEDTELEIVFTEKDKTASDKRSYAIKYMDEIGDESVTRLVTQVIKLGIINGATDIHIESESDGAHIRYRIDGILRPLDDPGTAQAIRNKIYPIVSRIKILANMDISEKRLPQDGSFKMNYFDKTTNESNLFDFRVATMNVTGIRENVVIRILDPRRAAGLSLAKLNFEPDTEKALRGFLSSPTGMVLVTGPTGSGKTSTLYAAIKYVYSPGIKILTVEDPIEYTFGGITQTQIKPRIGLTFASALKSFLRHDPDVIMVGEIRDSETASTAVKAAQTGHLLLSTLHTNDSTSALTRLADLGIGGDQISSSMLGVIAQRLIRYNCPRCSVPYTPSRMEWAQFFEALPLGFQFRHGRGCDFCGHTGFKGRTILSEVFVPDQETLAMIKNGVPSMDIRAIAIHKGMRTMMDCAMSKIKSLSLKEILRTVPAHLIKEFKSRYKSQDLAEILPGKSAGLAHAEPFDETQVEEEQISSEYEQEFMSEAAPVVEMPAFGSDDTDEGSGEIVADMALNKSFERSIMEEATHNYYAVPVSPGKAKPAAPGLGAGASSANERPLVMEGDKKEAEAEMALNSGFEAEIAGEIAKMEAAGSVAAPARAQSVAVPSAESASAVPAAPARARSVVAQSAPVGPSAQGKKHFASAQQLLDEKDYDGAIAELKLAARDDVLNDECEELMEFCFEKKTSQLL